MGHAIPKNGKMHPPSHRFLGGLVFGREKEYLRPCAPGLLRWLSREGSDCFPLIFPTNSRFPQGSVRCCRIAQLP